MARFSKIPAGQAGGTKLCSRREVNPELSVEAAFDATAFEALLEKALGPLERTDDGFAVGVRDEESGIAFEAYAGPSGPAYGGTNRYFTRVGSGYRLRRSVRDVLAGFERWLTMTS